MVTLQDLKNGTAARLRPAQLGKLAGSGTGTVYRHIKNKKLRALVDRATGRLYIAAADALDYLAAEEYSHNPQNANALRLMEKAREAKKNWARAN